jgi:hypothetical protein
MLQLGRCIGRIAAGDFWLCSDAAAFIAVMRAES